MRITTAIIGIMGLGLSLTWGQIQSFGDMGGIDWSTRVVTAKGIGAPNPAMPAVTARPMAIQAARTVALRNALELIKGINLSSTTTVENYMVQSDIVRTSVQGYISTFKESEPRYMSDKTIEITVTIPLDNQLSETLLPKEITNTPQALASTRPAATGSGAFTGLVIDARGLGIVPAMAPKIVDEAGKEIYGSAYVNRQFAVKWGMAGYAKTPEQAASAMGDRIGKNPGVIKAVRSSGTTKCDLVLSNNDARSIEAAAQSMNFLSDCRVVIVVD